MATGKMIASVGESELTCSMKVPVAGKHRVKVFCTGAVNLSFTEDKVALETAARRGELKDGVTVDAAAASGHRGRTERITAVKNDLLSKLEAKGVPSGKMNDLRLAAEKAAQLAGNENDFLKRFQAIAGDALK